MLFQNNFLGGTFMKMNYTFRKITAWTCIFAICSILTICPKTTSIAYNAHTQQEAVDWANAQIGNSLDYDGVYGAQCVDLIKYYYDYFGVADYARGNANAYMTNAIPDGWTRVYDNYQPGDIAVWKTDHSCGTCNTGSLGHVGIITSADSTGFNAVNQNFNNTSHCTHNWFWCSALACAIRPNYSNNNGGGNNSGNLSYSNLHTEFVDTWNAGLYGKIDNPNRLTVSEVGVWIWDSAGNLVVDHKESCGLKTSYVEQRLNIVGEALPSGLKSGETYSYQMYAVANGTTCKSSTERFTVVDDQGPVISNVQITNVTSNGYTVSCTVTDNYQVDRVQFPSWTALNDQDDIQADWGTNPSATGTKNGNTYTYEVKISDHNNESGRYHTHIYAYDKAGNQTSCHATNDTIVPEKVVATPTPVVTPEPTKTPVITPEPVITPAPVVTPEPTVAPVITPEPIIIPVPIVTPEPTMAPVITPEPVITSEPTETPVFTTTPEPVESPDTPSAPQETITKPKKVTVYSSISLSKKKMTVIWSLVNQANGYEIEYATNKKFTASKKVTIAQKWKSTKTIKKLTSKKKYYVRVRAYKLVDGEKLYGKWSSTKSCKIR